MTPNKLAILISACIWLLPGCKSPGSAERVCRVADSLSGAVNGSILALKNCNTVSREKAITVFSHYQSFIQNSLGDTLTKAEADHLRGFAESGQILTDFAANSELLSQRASTLLSQLASLSAEARSGSRKSMELDSYLGAERTAAAELVSKAMEQEGLCQRALQEFRNSLPAVERLIRQRNAGLLPIVVRDSIPF